VTEPTAPSSGNPPPHPSYPSSLPRPILVVISLFALLVLLLRLWSSFNEPQIRSRLELAQANVVLEASRWQGQDANLASVRQALVGNDPARLLDQTLKQYQELAAIATKQQTSLAQKLTISPNEVSLRLAQAQNQEVLVQLQNDIGLIQAQRGDTPAAIATWQAAQAIPTASPLTASPLTANSEPEPPALGKPAPQQTTAILLGLWSQPPQILPDPDQQLRGGLDGWFRNRALTQLYQVQQYSDKVEALDIAEQRTAQQALQSLGILLGMPVFGALLGLGIGLFLLVQWPLRRKQAILAPSALGRWTVPWDGAVIWQVMVGFFLCGQVLAPLMAQVLLAGSDSGLAKLGITLSGDRHQAWGSVLVYLSLASLSLGIMLLSIQGFRPWPEGWFKLKFNSGWILWGLGGYFVALPLVALVSSLNERIWQGQGGSNPILDIVFEGRDPGAIALFWFTAAVLAPIFEEILFRGFLLASLSRYLPSWGAILLSALLFAAVHLSAAEVLPLMTLGVLLGFVYMRSRSLLASMLLHALWNSGTFIGLLVLSSATASGR
jgi:uncharacterized protein